MHLLSPDVIVDPNLPLNRSKHASFPSIESLVGEVLRFLFYYNAW